MPTRTRGASTLAQARSGTRVRVAGVVADAVTSRHLAALGLRAGSVVELVRNLGADGVVVGLAEDRLALPRDLAAAIRVEDGAGTVAPTVQERRETAA